MKVAIVGGGIGGMTLALSLVDAGIANVNIYESAPSVEELGVGINVLPHAARELSELGLLDALRAVGISTDEWVLCSKHGQRIWSEPRGLAAGYRWPQLSIHRGQLLGVLHRAVCDRLGREHVRTGHHVVRFGQDTNGVWGECVERGSGARLGHIEADLLVGCDGVHSVVRRTLYPDEGPPKWNGITMWRGVTVAAPFLSGRRPGPAANVELWTSHLARRCCSSDVPGRRKRGVPGNHRRPRLSPQTRATAVG